MYYSFESINYNNAASLNHGKYNAANKAHEDIIRFLDLETLYCIDKPGNKASNFFQIMKARQIAKEKSIILQYPLYLSDFYRIFFKYNKHSVCLIHDLISLRDKDSSYISTEIECLNQFGNVIVHNEVMKDWLVEHGCTSNLICLDLFDYATESQIFDVNNDETSTRIAFAGNLDKSVFASNLGKEKSSNLIWKVFGVCSHPENFSGSIDYCGKFLPDELPEELAKCHYGLIWDGDSLDTCNGVFGEYLRYNNPHKCSMYLSVGIPVIVWKQAAIARFVEREQCGVLVDSLLDLEEKLHSISSSEYNKLRNNAKRISMQVRNGEYTKRAMSLVADN